MKKIMAIGMLTVAIVVATITLSDVNTTDCFTGNQADAAPEEKLTVINKQTETNLEETQVVSIYNIPEESITIVEEELNSFGAPEAEAPKATPVPTKAPSKLNQTAIATSSLNVRIEPSTDSNIVGKMGIGTFATVKSLEGEWAYIQSGNVKGYVNTNYVVTGSKAKELEKDYVVKYATVKANSLKVRKTASTEADVITKIENLSVHQVISEGQEWIKIKVENTDVTGYVSKEFVTVKAKKLYAMTLEEEKERKEAERLEQERIEKELKEEEERKAEEERRAEEVKKAEEEKKREEAEQKRKEELKKQKEEEAKKEQKEDLAAYNIKLLACIVYAEAGSESYEGKLAVASAIMNRVKSSRYPNSIHDVVYQPGQFSPVSSGSLSIQLGCYKYYSSKNQLDCIKAAKAAIAGSSNIGNRKSFRPSRSVDVDAISNAIVIGNHIFY